MRTMLLSRPHKDPTRLHAAGRLRLTGHRPLAGAMVTCRGEALATDRTQTRWPPPWGFPCALRLSRGTWDEWMEVAEG